MLSEKEDIFASQKIPHVDGSMENIDDLNDAIEPCLPKSMSNNSLTWRIIEKKIGFVSNQVNCV